MYKFFVQENQLNENQIIIQGSDVNHISNVLRLKLGENIKIALKETGETYTSEIAKIKKDQVICKIILKDNEKVESNVNIDLYQALPKSDKMEYIIQKTTELGIKRVIPVNMERCIVKLDKKAEDKKIERWQKIAEVAAKQSKRDIVPKIEKIIKIEDICQNIKEYDIILLAYENEDSITIKDELKKINGNSLNIGIIIGPEGGFSPNEVSQLINSGAKCVSLGKRILRTETAPIVMISNIIYEFEL